MPDQADWEDRTALSDEQGQSQALLSSLLDQVQTPKATWSGQISGGYQVELYGSGSDSDQLRLLSPSGHLCARVYLDASGAQVEVFGASLRVHARDILRIEGDTVEVCARTELKLASGGAIRQHAVTSIESEAFEHQIESTHGEIRLIANDDVAIDGERIRLNSPPVPIPSHLNPPTPAPRVSQADAAPPLPEAHEIPE